MTNDSIVMPFVYVAALASGFIFGHLIPSRQVEILERRLDSKIEDMEEEIEDLKEKLETRDEAIRSAEQKLREVADSLAELLD